MAYLLALFLGFAPAGSDIERGGKLAEPRLNHR
jgi:hypothetical protein